LKQNQSLVEAFNIFIYYGIPILQSTSSAIEID